ncbi:carbon storage regulator CsrA [Campylobacter hyointestinalis]|uniref:Translational regulator CsrA n=1 Tax=Campylobacter hyointestinalis subsp. lawsonii TaxID=91353 RepID=A0AAV6EF89_CAMHY|nr:carbon storage regulator CsrA [Campylobacter hyointestinalis]ANE32730.1 carbon storage regulator [Campylobacter hyointestinalis subsp. hyointestinalis LMG 9260]ANE34425.1 carbon storage regulator [Campylobacter hyointestinalis subsp. lawsonii CCUG 27631]KAB0612124.1 carbon storage regulator CsrA [Campylobacter hyointestinalis subsp. lawsonii]QKF69384.1 carbon storage regulator [Campylobacter hyointestinalis subsp. lawsonii]RAZ28297.1 carbon storage regulator [Campylobacter hyointestinalis s
MLILTRKNGEAVQIGADIEIKIIESSKNSVKIGIEAPKSILILRSELVSEVAISNQKASATGKNSLDELSKKFQK